MMGILGEVKSKQKHFAVGGREVLCIDADFPCGKSPAAMHILNLVEALCDYAEREPLKGAADALMRAVEVGQGHRFRRWVYRVALSEAPAGRKQRVTVTVLFSSFDVHLGERSDRLRRLEMLWDAQGVLQTVKKHKKWERSAKKQKRKDDIRQGAAL
jgi:hypothetical protein